MKAVQFNQFGDVDVLQIVDKPKPEAINDRVVVRVRAAGINPGEAGIFKGELEDMFPTTLPCGEGADFAGVVEAVGGDVSGFDVGDEVVGYSDERSSQAEFVSVPANQLVAKPAEVPFEVGGGLQVAGSTAYAMMQKFNISADDTVVVAGASSAVGLLVGHLAHQAGARVIGLASPNYHEWLKEHGVEPVDYHSDPTSALKEIDGITTFFDCIGKGYIDMALELGVPKVRINTIKDFAGAQQHGVQAVGGMDVKGSDSLAALLPMLADGRLELPVARTFPLDQVQDAFRYQLSKHDIGKVVLIP